MIYSNKINKKIIELRERYHNILPGKESLIKLISEIEVSEHVYNSNAIENSTLTLEETEKILMQIEIDRYINEREIYEAKNLARVVEYIDIKAKDKTLDTEMILLLHKMLISNIRDDIAGRFRKEGEWVKVGNHLGSDPKLVNAKISMVLSNYNSKHAIDIVKRITSLHLDFESIHPFVDGNGRIGRVINNYLLIREGFVPINIKFTDRQKYYNAFKEYNEENKKGIMESMVATALMQSYYKRLAYMEGKDIVTLAEYSKKHKISHSNLINKANRGTIEAFIDRGVWKIGM